MSAKDNNKDMNIEIKYIKRAFHMPRECSGIDVAIDSAKFHKYFNTCDIQEIRKRVEYILSKEFGEERFKWNYSYDEYGDSVGACAHHISLTRNKKKIEF